VSEIVSSDRVEDIVGATRHETEHIGRAVSTDQMVYILHSVECKAWSSDLRECPFSRALDNGVDIREWTLDAATLLAVHDGHLSPKGDR